MRLLIYGINYTPELTGVGKYTGEMAEWLVAQGHEVFVVTAPPYYPDWKIKAGFSARRYSSELLGGVKVWRCPLWVPTQPSGFKRLLHLASFAISSLPLILWQGLRWQPDVVLVVEPPFFCVAGALLTASLSGAKSWLHIQDFEIDAGFDLGLLPSTQFIRSLAFAQERWFMERFDRISTISDRMIKRLKAKGVQASKCVYFPNWVDTNTIYPSPEVNPLREELGITPDTFVALYSGSMAKKQGLEVLIATAQQLVASHPKILFVLCGEGSAKSQLIKLAEGMPNVRFLNLQPIERLNALLNLANVHLLPQIPNAADLVMPSKLKGMCASGRPVVATATHGTQVAQVVQRCGIVVPPGDVTALAKAIVYLATNVEECTQLSEGAREFAVTQWHQEKVLGQLEKKLQELCSSQNLERNSANAVGLEYSLETSLKTGVTENYLSINQTKPISNYLMEVGLITESQVDSALKEQRNTGEQLGEILVKRGWITQQTVDELEKSKILLEQTRVVEITSENKRSY